MLGCSRVCKGLDIPIENWFTAYAMPWCVIRLWRMALPTIAWNRRFSSSSGRPSLPAAPETAPCRTPTSPTACSAVSHEPSPGLVLLGGRRRAIPLEYHRGDLHPKHPRHVGTGRGTSSRATRWGTSSLATRWGTPFPCHKEGGFPPLPQRGNSSSPQREGGESSPALPQGGGISPLATTGELVPLATKGGGRVPPPCHTGGIHPSCHEEGGGGE